MATTTNAVNRGGYQYGQYDPKWNAQQKRQQDLSWYNDATGRLKNKGLAQGTDPWLKNAQRIYDIGNRYGLNWQQHVGSWRPDGAQAGAGQGQTNTNTGGNTGGAGALNAPEGLRPENLPMFNLLTNQEKRHFIRIRRGDPRAALKWMQNATKGRTAGGDTGAGGNVDNNPGAGNTDGGAPGADTGNSGNTGNTGDTGDQMDFTQYQSPMTKALMDAMAQGFSTMQAYEPQYFEGSPLYQFQKQKGSADLEKLMAARGLTNSGAEIQANSDFLANLNATEAEKQRQYAEANRDRQQRAMEFVANFDRQEREDLRNQWNVDLDRKQNIAQFEAGRGDRRQELMVNFLNNVLGLQSQNDIARLSQSGLGAQTDLTKALLQAMTNNIMSQVPRGGGGRGGGTPPPPPSNNMTDLFQILMRYGNNAGNNDLFNVFARGLTGK